MSDTAVDEMSFEQAMAELEQVLGQLERGDVALDESIALFERGALLKKRCETKLKEAEEKVDRKSTRLNSSHANISYAVFCLKKKTTVDGPHTQHRSTCTTPRGEK